MKKQMVVAVLLFVTTSMGMSCQNEFERLRKTSLKDLKQKAIDNNSASLISFVQGYLNKYEEIQGILSDLNKETNGVIRATADPDLEKKDSNKFYCYNPLDLTPQEIDKRWRQIHAADCKYISLMVTIKNQFFSPAVPIQPCNKK
jgi:hypothetical protein